MKPTLRLLFACIALLAAFGAASCNKNKQKLAPDPEFSINVMEVPEFWPREDKDWPKDEDKRLVMEGTLADRGRPDFFRVVWTADRRIVRQREMVDALEKKGQGLTAPELEWIYADDGKIVRFHKDKAEVRDMDDRLATICTLGDPNDVKVRRDAAGTNTEIFTYYNTGQIMYFEQKTGLRLREDQVPATPGYKGRM